VSSALAPEAEATLLHHGEPHVRRTFTVAAAALVTLSCALPRRGAEARSARGQLLAAKQLIIEANYRNLTGLAGQMDHTLISGQMIIL
jgi:hypothetical protein